MSKFFTANRIFENVTQIGGLGGELCYLVEGGERALLIDGLSGVGSLKAFVRELTDLPVELALTHGHVDHAGAAFEYGVCRVHPADVEMLYEHGDPARRYDFATRGRPAGAFMPVPEDVVPRCAVRTLPVGDGDVFDLGGVQIEAIAVPGHTGGTLVFLDRAHRAVYSGDACNPNTLLALPGSTTIETYRQSLLHFAAFSDAFDVLYGGHGIGAVEKRIIGRRPSCAMRSWPARTMRTRWRTSAANSSTHAASPAISSAATADSPTSPTEKKPFSTNRRKSNMKVLLINGSPRRNGCTFTALSEVEKTLHREGIETELVQLGAKAVQGCIACGRCKTLGRCVFDDLVNETAPKLEAADGLVVGSPVYYASANGSLIAFLDRLFYSTPFDKTMKAGAAVLSCRRGGASASFDELNKYFTISGMPVVSSQYWNSVHGNTPEEVGQDLEGLQIMRTLGRNMAFLVKSIVLGREKLGLPEKEPRISTNFIR